MKKSYQENCTQGFRKVNKEWVLKKETVGMLFAAQEQALATNSIKAKIDKQPFSPKCRSCGTKEETVMHLVSGCPKLAQKQYKRRHDNVTRRAHWELRKKHGLDKLA